MGPPVVPTPSPLQARSLLRAPAADQRDWTDVSLGWGSRPQETGTFAASGAAAWTREYLAMKSSVASRASSSGR